MRLRGTRLTAIANAARLVVAGYSPLSLFSASEPGVWYDPSDLSTLFQDSAGTKPVTTVEQPVGLMLDKSKGLVLGPEKVVGGVFVDGAPGWSKEEPPTLFTVVNGVLTVDGNGNAGGAVQSFTTTAGVAYEIVGQMARGAGAGAAEIRALAGDGAGGVGTILSSVSTTSETLVNVRLVFTANSSTSALYLRGNIVASFAGLSVRELPGNHAYQTTATSRPVLSARYNLLTKTEQFDDAVWPKDAASVTPDIVAAPDGSLTADKLVASATNANHLLNRTGAFKTVSGALYTYTMFAKAAEYSWIRLQVQVTAFPETWANFNVATGAVGLTTGNVQAIITAEANGWYRCSITAMANASNNSGVQPFVLDSNRGTANPSYTGDGTSGIYIWGADLRVANDGANLPPYQRVNTATDYDTVGFPHYLRFDGVDDWLVTNTITPGIDKVQVFAGVRKLSDAAAGVLIESSASFAANSGCFLLGPRNWGASTGLPWLFASQGSVNPGVGAETGPYAAPITQVISGLGDISGDRATLRVNGTQAAQSTTDQGTGNYIAYPLYIGRRGGTTLPFNGHIYGLIVRFGSNLPAATIEKTEKYINTKTRAY